MKLYKRMYFDSKLNKDQLSIIQALKNGEVFPKYYFLAIDPEVEGQFSIYPGFLFWEDLMKKESLYVVGIASGKKSAKQLLMTIITDLHIAKGITDLRQYFLEGDYE